MHLLLRALRWRLAASVATVLLVAVTVMGAVVGPLWTRAGSESLLRDALNQTGEDNNSAIFVGRGDPNAASLAQVKKAADASPLDDSLPVIGGLKLLSEVGTSVASSYLGQLLYREGSCAQVVIVSGRCPTQPGEVMINRSTAERLHLTHGRLDAKVQALEQVAPSVPLTEDVVGVYLPKDLRSPYWSGEASYDFQPAPNPGDGTNAGQLAATLTSLSTMEQLVRSSPQSLNGFVTEVRPFDVSRVRLDAVPTLRRQVAHATAMAAAASTQQLPISLTDQVTYQFDSAHAEGSALGRASTAVLAQLVLLSGVVLLLVVSGSATARGPEIASARLRGLRTRTVLGLALLEPLVLVAAGAPVGAVLAYVLARGMAAGRLVSGTPVLVGVGAVEALLVALVIVALAVVLVVARQLGRPVLDLWQRTDQSPSRAGIGAQLVSAVVLAVVGVVLAHEGHSAALLAPVPLTLAVAVLGVRLLPLLFAPSVRRTRARRRLVPFLAVRQLVRRREGALLAGLLVVAFGLAGTATSAWSVANRAADTRARAEIGAPVVLILEPDATHPEADLRAAVRKADPTGREAMAVLEHLPSSGDPGGDYLVVDASRLAAVASWDDRYDGGSVDVVAKALEQQQGKLPSVYVTRAVSRDPHSNLATGLPANAALITGVDGRQTPVDVRGVVNALPRALDNGTISDFSAIKGVDVDDYVSIDEAWMTHKDPAVVRSLAQQGFQVFTTQTVPADRALLTRQGPALAVLLSLVSAVIAMLLAAATTLFLVLTGARRRGWELAALASVGVPAAVLRRSSRRESLLLQVAGLVLGAVAAGIAATLTLSHVPYFSDVTPVTVSTRPAPLPLLVLALVAIALIVATAGLAGRVLQRASDPAQLREVQA